LMPRLPGEEEVGDDSSKDGVLTVITCNWPESPWFWWTDDRGLFSPCSWEELVVRGSLWLRSAKLLVWALFWPLSAMALISDVLWACGESGWHSSRCDSCAAVVICGEQRRRLRRGADKHRTWWIMGLLTCKF
jgi:hypothetical protein